jgi:hypothetical protein
LAGAQYTGAAATSLSAVSPFDGVCVARTHMRAGIHSGASSFWSEGPSRPCNPAHAAAIRRPSSVSATLPRPRRSRGQCPRCFVGIWCRSSTSGGGQLRQFPSGARHRLRTNLPTSFQRTCRHVGLRRSHPGPPDSHKPWSVAQRRIHTTEVVGSSPSSPTRPEPQVRCHPILTVRLGIVRRKRIGRD